MLFILLILMTAFCMEAIGTYISVFGLGALFAGDPVILTMAVILDVAKIVTVSFLYQYWKPLRSILKYYMLSAVIILMTITSAGAFGYLSAAFQKATQSVMEISLKSESYKNEKASLLTEKDSLTHQQADIDKQIAQLPSNYITGRQRLMKSFKPEEDRIRARLNVITKRTDELTTEILQVENQNIDKEVHAGPIIYVAKAFNITLEEASKWIIFIIIFVFDPLAIGLLLAGNFLTKRRLELKEKVLTIEPEPEPEYVPEIIPEPEIIIPQGIKSIQSTEENVIIIPQGFPLMSKIPLEPILKEEPLTLEEQELLSKVYDDIDTGEDLSDLNEFYEADTSGVLAEAVSNYIPYNPIEINGDINYSGSPQADLIVEEPMKSSLENIIINMPDALFSPQKTSSNKKDLYQ